MRLESGKLIALGLLLAAGVFLITKDSKADLASDAKLCQSVEAIEQQCSTLSQQACQALLEKCRDYYEQQADEYRQTVKEKETQQRSFENQIAIFSNKIKQLNTLIQRNTVLIKDLGLQIGDTENSIEDTALKIDVNKEQLTQILRRLYEQDKLSELEVLLSGQSFAEFLENITSLEALQNENRKLLLEIESLYQYLAGQRDKLASEKENLQRVVLNTQLQREQSEQVKKQQQQLLTATKGEKELYQDYLAEAESKAAEIRSRIFELAQIAEASAPTLEQAYAIAKSVQDATGVRASLLLGLLTVESAIGKNVGQCNCSGSATCKHPEIGYQDVMTKGQWSYFLEITKELGLEPSTTPVSCSISGGAVQWGGAMGPAQFMPATWTLYKERINALLATSSWPANPWRIRDAFLAAGLYLSDWGAASQTYNDEIGAATAYLCGTNRLTQRCQAAGGAGYRYQVMKKASEYQEFVDQGILR